MLRGLSGLSLLCALATCAPSVTAPDERVIAARDFGGVVTVTVRDIIIVAPPMAADEWQVDYPPSLLEALTPSDRLRSPGPDGWRFRAIATGEGDLVIRPVFKPDPIGAGAPPPAAARFTVTIRAK